MWSPWDVGVLTRMLKSIISNNSCQGVSWGQESKADSHRSYSWLLLYSPPWNSLPSGSQHKCNPVLQFYLLLSKHDSNIYGIEGKYTNKDFKRPQSVTSATSASLLARKGMLIRLTHNINFTGHGFISAILGWQWLAPLLACSPLILAYLNWIYSDSQKCVHV